MVCMTQGSAKDGWADIFSDLVSLVDGAPQPPGRFAHALTRQDQAAAHAVAVAWGWLTRTKRTCSAVFALEEKGYGSESRPLIRSVIEHTIRLRWGADLEMHIFVEVLLRIQSWSLEKTVEAAKNGWPLSAELLQTIEESMAEASEDFKFLDTYRHLTNVVASNVSEFGGLYQFWLLETQYSHPTLTSANPYFSTDSENRNWTLRDSPRSENRRVEILLPSLLWLCTGAFGKISGLSDYFEDPLQDISDRMQIAGAAMT